jgi:hypothetical protein
MKVRQSAFAWGKDQLLRFIGPSSDFSISEETMLVEFKLMLAMLKVGWKCVKMSGMTDLAGLSDIVV